MSSADHIGDHAFVLLDAARSIHETAGEPGSSAEATEVLARLEAALQLLSSGWYQVAADAAPTSVSREQEVRLKGALHDVAAACARTARVCRDARPALQPLIDSPEARAELPV